MARMGIVAGLGFAALAGGLGAATEAATLELRYRVPLTGTVTVSRLDGELDADGNRFTVTGIAAFTVNGADALRPFLIYSTDHGLNGAPYRPAVVTLDGSFVDFLLGLPGQNTAAYVFAVGNQTYRDALTAYPGLFPDGIFGTLTQHGGNDTYQNFSRADYNARLVDGAVPEPGSWATMLAGLGLVGAGLRSRRRSIRFAA